ncbi:alpha/beta hydrolase family protein [Elizabethkingia anophelis]|uniref:alpha/beta hydrolase family protein n=1 Tax=Elizabethkingia anophelis TaxID=1117645 RepID=UPI00136C4458|nr:prolyl oligopeptidase family serine peptidase [Elizabethkingia anophelis]MYY43976.1 S9 family peptidase [Elizabethkingia anophelis]
MKKIKLIVILFLLTGSYYNGQVLHDSLKNCMSKFYNLYFQEFSDNGKYVSIRKQYENNTDTLMVFGTERKIPLVGYNTKMSKAKFFKDDYLMSSGIGKAELWNLKTGQKIQYNNVKNAIVLPEKNQFLIWDNHNELSWYSTSGKLLQKFNDVNLVIDDKKGKFWYVKRNGDKTEVWDTSGLLYATDKTISKVELSKSGEKLFVYETDKGLRKRAITFIYLKDKKIESPRGFSVPESEYLYIEEIGDGTGYLISSLNSIKPDKMGLVDVWYGNDYNLEDKFQSRSEYQYWIWRPEFGHLQKILNDKLSKVGLIGSDRYFLVCTPSESKDYTKDSAGFGSLVSVYDAKKETFIFLGELPSFKENDRDNKGTFGGATSKVYTSKNGEYIIYRKAQDAWELLHLPTGKKFYIPGRDLERPVFSNDNTHIYFEGEFDLWNYDIAKSDLKRMHISETKSVRMVNVEYKTFPSAGSSMSFDCNTIDLKKPLLLKIWNRDQNNDISYVLWKYGAKQTIVNPSLDLIENFKFDKKLSKFAYFRENYNKPTEVVFKDLKKDSKVLFSVSDKEALEIKQEVIHYKSPVGKKLQGTLYYPSKFNPNKKYPMVVYIYRLLRRSANMYKIPRVEDVNIRILLKRGYFVYLPDIEYNPSGPGVSALDCVNNAMDALGDEKNIDIAKVGLTGYSMGGYETSFIATKSNRFVTYIAGAGSSDLVRAFYSFSYGFRSPLYWRYENHIYEMKVPFAQNKNLYIKNSPIHNVEKVNAPILLWAGKEDDNVPADEVMEFYIGLKRYKKPVVALFYPDQGHSFVGAAFEDYFTRSLEWWDYFLKDQKNVPWINKEVNKSN